MFTITTPPDATTIDVVHDDKYATLSYGDDSLTLPILNAPGNTYIVVFLTSAGKLLFVPDEPVTIAATLTYQIDSVTLALYPVPALTTPEEV
jgi:hypothetical protein